MTDFPFQAGGALTNAHATVYIERQAEQKALESLYKMEYLLIIEPRQQGKTSLINHLMRHPALDDVVFAYIDVSSLDDSSEAAWYQRLCSRILRQLHSIIPRHQWPPIPKNGADWRDFLSDVALLISQSQAQRRLLIALDEIGAVSFPWATDFFITMRDIYNSRQGEIWFNHLTFLLVGAFNPSDLIQDDNISPFNIAQQVYLPDFTLAQVHELVSKGAWSDEQIPTLAERIHYWTDGQPYLTQKLCTYLAPDAKVADVDSAVSRLRREDNKHLPSMLKRLNSEPKLRKYVDQIEAGRRRSKLYAEIKWQSKLQLIGFIKADEEGYCIIRNRIYRQALANREDEQPIEKVALPKAAPLADKTTIEQLQAIFDQMTAWANPNAYRDMAYMLADEYYKRGDYQKARKALEQAHKAIESMWVGMRQQTDKQELAASNREFYGLLVCCCLRDGEQHAAFEYAAVSKGRAFVDLLTTARFDIFKAGANDAALRTQLSKIDELRQQIGQLVERLNNGESQHVQRDNARLRRYRRREAKFWKELSRKYPALGATQSAAALSATQAQELADELDATLVEFYQHAEGWAAFIVTPEGIHHVALDKVNDDFLQKKVLSWLKKIENPLYHTLASYWALDEWYEVLIRPIRSHLPTDRRLILAPAGVLHLIPLSIARNRYTNYYLCDEYTVASVPSLGALRVALEQSNKNASSISGQGKGALDKVLSVAYAGQSKWKAHPDENIARQYLHHAQSEAQAIAAVFPNSILLHDEQATSQAVITHAKAQHVIHLICHGIFDPESPERSGLALSDGNLTIQRMITELWLTDTRLATLSACLTHRVALKAGEEHVGLVQAIMTAGAQAVVASLWSVDDQATRVYFEHFYKTLTAGEAPANALQQAMQYVRQQEDWKHPYYWAGFQVSGLAFDLQA